MLDTLELHPSAQQLDSGTLAEHVFRLIQAAIVKGEIAPGSKISEPELARTYGISRGPLREAIHRLEDRSCWFACRMLAPGWSHSVMPS